MERPKLNFRFHNPNPKQGFETIVQVCIKANIQRVDDLVAHELMEKSKNDEVKKEEESKC